MSSTATTTATQAKPTTSLIEWATQHLTALYTAKTKDDFDAAFEAFFSNSLSATLNNGPLSRADYQKALSDERALERSATIKIDNSVSARDADGTEQPVAANEKGVVGLFFTAAFAEKIFQLGFPKMHTVNSSMNLLCVLFHVQNLFNCHLMCIWYRIAEDDTVPLGPILPGDTIDIRRVFSVNQILLDSPDPVLIQRPHPEA